MNNKIWYFVIGFVVVVIVAVIAFRNLSSAITSPQVPATPTPTASVSETPSESGIVGSWKWTKTTMNDGKVTTPAKPDAFVATFNQDGTVGSTTDCNSLSGEYKLLPDNGIKFTQFASTLMYCEGSQEIEYSKTLQSANSYKVSGAELWLMLPYDSGTMVFVSKN